MSATTCSSGREKGKGRKVAIEEALRRVAEAGEEIGEARGERLTSESSTGGSRNGWIVLACKNRLE